MDTLPPPPPPPFAVRPMFIVNMDESSYDAELSELALWVRYLLVPTYGRPVTSSAPWCSRWWEHQEAVAVLHGLWLAWQEMTGPAGGRTGPASWHRDYLAPAMENLRDPNGPFGGCRPGVHRDEEPPAVEDFPGTSDE